MNHGKREGIIMHSCDECGAWFHAKCGLVNISNLTDDEHLGYNFCSIQDVDFQIDTYKYYKSYNFGHTIALPSLIIVLMLTFFGYKFLLASTCKYF